MCGGSYGSGGFGSLPYGAGSTVHIGTAAAVARNAVRVAFEGTPEMDDPATSWDALNPGNWTLQPYIPFDATVRLAVFVEPASQDSVIVYFDGPLDPSVEYAIVVSDRLRSSLGDTIPQAPECRTAYFVSLGEQHVANTAAVAQAIDGAVDLANPQTQGDAPGDRAPLGTFQRTPQGDFAAEAGRVYLRKRVIRRLTTSVGAFFHLPRYGVGQKLKTLVRPDQIRRLAAEAQRQLRSEPDVVSATVTARQDPDSAELVFVDAKVRDRFGNAVEVAVPVVFGG